MATLLRDIRSALRALKKTPGTTAVIILALALGIGINTAVFSLAQAVMLRALPYENPDRLVAIWQTARGRGLDRIPVGVGDFYHWQNHGTSFEGLALFRGGTLNVTGDGNPESVDAAETTASFFDLLGIRPALGRTFKPGDNDPGSAQIVVLSHEYWKQRYGGDPQAVGKKILLDDDGYEIVGILPEGLRLPGIGEFHIFMPAAWAPEDRQVALRFTYSAIGRLKPGVTEDQARAELATLSKSLEESYPQMREGIGTDLQSLREEAVGDFRPALLILLGAVAFVLLIACANAANLLLVRATSRTREVALRLVLGAGRATIIRQFLTESVVLSVLGGCLGLLLAAALIPVLISLGPGELLSDAGLNPVVLLFTLGLSVVTGLLFGMTPALQVSRVSFVETLKESAGSVVGGGRSQKLRGLLVASEIAVALILLIGAGLMMRSLFLLQKVDPGFRPDHLLTLELALPEAKYPEDSNEKAFFRQAVERLSQLPQVTSVGAVSELPFSEAVGTQLITIEGRPVRTMEDVPSSDVRQVSPKYLETMGISLRKGRGFSTDDRPDSPPVALVNETFAQRLFPGENAIGKRMRIGVPAELEPESEVGPWLTIVGLVGDVRHTTLKEPAQPEVYVLHEQAASSRGSMSLVLRTSSDPSALAQAVRTAIWEIDPNLPIANVNTMEELMSKSTAQTRFTFLLLAFFAVSALGLAVLGIYGVMSYFVSQRVHEIGLRLALGAARPQVLLLIIRQSLLLTAVGLAAGLTAAFALSRVLTSQLYGISSHDPVTFVGIPALLLVVALLATGLPAHRATRVQPMAALRLD